MSSKSQLSTPCRYPTPTPFFPLPRDTGSLQALLELTVFNRGKEFFQNVILEILEWLGCMALPLQIQHFEIVHFYSILVPDLKNGTKPPPHFLPPCPGTCLFCWLEPSPSSQQQPQESSSLSQAPESQPATHSRAPTWGSGPCQLSSC